MFTFLNFLHPDPWKIIQQFGTVAQLGSMRPNLCQPYACRKALTEKNRQHLNNNAYSTHP